MSDVARLVVAVAALAAQEDHKGMLAMLRGLPAADCQAVAYFLACDLARAELRPYETPDGEVPAEARRRLIARKRAICSVLAKIDAAPDPFAATLAELEALGGES